MNSARQAGQKINIHKSAAFLYTNNELPESDSIKKKIPFKITQKYLGINLTKVVKDLYTENYIKHW